MQHPVRFRSRINDPAPVTDISSRSRRPAEAHTRYLESLGTIEALMRVWIGAPDEAGSLDGKEILARLEAMAIHAKEPKCPLCGLRETQEAERGFWETAKLYMKSAHRHSPASLVELAVNRAEDGVSDPFLEWPFVDLLAALIANEKDAQPSPP